MTEAQLLDGQAFNRLVVEKQLEGKTWEQNGYVYTGFMGLNGYELYRAYGPKWKMFYQARRVCTQSAVGGGALTVRVSIPTGMVGKLVSIFVQGTATAGNVTSVFIRDEDAATDFQMSAMAAGASTAAYLPTIGANAASTGVNGFSNGMLFGPGEFIYFTCSAAAQTETLTVGIKLLLPIEATAASVTWDTTGSAGTPTLAASTISAANTLQAVLEP